MHGLLFGVGVAALVLIALAAATRAGSGYEQIVRCRAGHLFTSTMVPGASLKAVRLGVARFQWCPVGRHWTLVRRVDERTLTTAELDAARSVHDVRVP